jgi:hypothetical protein
VYLETKGDVLGPSTFVSLSGSTCWLLCPLERCNNHEESLFVIVVVVVVVIKDFSGLIKGADPDWSDQSRRSANLVFKQSTFHPGIPAITLVLT